MIQFIKELFFACCIVYAMLYASACISIDQTTAYQAITGVK